MNSKNGYIFQFFVSLIPLIYMGSVWGTLPEIVPTHSNLQMEVDDYGSKDQILYLVIFLVVLTNLTALLVRNITKWTSKDASVQNLSALNRISWIVVFILTATSIFIIYDVVKNSSNHQKVFTIKNIVCLLSLLFVGIGNYMRNIKPNYFFGIRTPWTLNNETNWRKTHYLGSTIWFFGGLIMFCMASFLPAEFANYIMIIGTLIISAIPVIYSYYLFKNKLV